MTNYNEERLQTITQAIIILDPQKYAGVIEELKLEREKLITTLIKD